MEQRHRSPTFTPAESNMLVNLVGNFRNIIMSKCMNSATNVAKEKVWLKITKQFNKENVGNNSRTPESLKAKWENLKRQYTKMYVEERNSLDTNNIFYNVHTIIESCKDMESLDALQQISDDSVDFRYNDNEGTIVISSLYPEVVTSKDGDSQNYNVKNTTNGNRNSSSTGNYSRFKKIKARSMNFSPIECQLLINLVKIEKDCVFSNEPYKKFRAWRRIAELFNKRFPEKKRTSRVLRTKYQNMKSVVRKLNNSVNIPKLNVKIIKHEPEFLETNDFCIKTDDCNNDLFDYSEIQNVSANHEVNGAPDPLKTVLTVLENCNSDSGIGYSSDTFHSLQDRDAATMQKQLLNYQLENAKLERKRIQDALDADAEERKVKSLINTMKLRTARLEMAAAESKLPMTHPALSYTESEESIIRFQ